MGGGGGGGKLSRVLDKPVHRVKIDKIHLDCSHRKLILESLDLCDSAICNKM